MGKNPLQVLKEGLSKVKPTVKKQKEFGSWTPTGRNDGNQWGGWVVADLDDPCAWKLEVILAGFGHQVHMQELQDTLITSYFTS